MKQIDIKLSIKELLKIYENKNIQLFLKGYNESVIERKSCWSVKDRSLLIHSIIKGMFINPVYLAIDNGLYSVIDGKQRIISIVDFVQNKYTIDPILFDDNGYSLKNKTFSELTPNLQYKILNYSLLIIKQEGTIQENIDTFIRCNNGDSVKPIDIFRAKMGEQLSFLREICNHELFNLFELGKTDNYKNYEMALYLLMIETNPAIGLAKKEKEEFVTNIESSNVINLNIKHRLIEKMNYLLNSFNNNKYNSLNNKDKYLKKSHVIILYKFIDTAIKNGISQIEFFEWCHSFFYLNKNSKSLYWVESSRGSTTSKNSIDIRYEELKINFDNYFGYGLSNILYYS